MPKDPSALDYKTLDKDFPLCTNCLALTIGGTGSGKSYFTYNYFLPIYIEHFKVKWVLVCSKTAGCDATLRAALDKCGANVIIDPKISQLFETAQQIRAQAIKMEYLYKAIKAHNPRTVIEDLKELVTQMKTYPTIQAELRKMVETLTEITDPENYSVIQRNALDNGPPDVDKDGRYIDKYASKIIRDDRESILRHYKANPDNPDEVEPIDETELSSENSEACVQLLKLENPVLTKIAQDKKYSQSDSDPDNVIIELSFAIIVKRKINKALENRLIRGRIKHNLKNFYYAAEDVYGDSYQPMMIIVDDNAVSSELSNQNSSFTQLCLTRRHLHCNVDILVQGVTYLNTSLRRNATSYHLLPTMSEEDIKLIEKRLPKGLIQGELSERYLQNIHQKERSQQMTHIFIAANPPVIVDGLPDCVEQYKL